MLFVSNIINVFTVTFDQLNASLLNKSIHVFKKQSFQPQTHQFPWKYLAATVFSIDNTHKYFLSCKSAY